MEFFAGAASMLVGPILDSIMSPKKQEKPRKERRERPQSDDSTHCMRGHSVKKGEDCSKCEVIQLRKDAIEEAARWATCDKGHRHLVSTGCTACQIAKAREDAEAATQKAAEEHKRQMAQREADHKKLMADKEREHEDELSKISEENEEEREKLKAEHDKEMRRGDLEKVKLTHEGLVSEFKRQAGTAREYHGPMNASLGRLDAEKQFKAQWKGIGSDPEIIRLVFFSSTGQGKSTLGNRILGDDSEDADQILKASPLAKACTQSIRHELTTWNAGDFKQRLCVIDTPGWNESEAADRMHANNLVRYLRGAQFINGLVVVKQHMTRFSQSDTMLLFRLMAMVGDDMWQHVCIVATSVEGRNARKRHWDEWKNSLYEQLESKYRLTALLQATARPQAPGVTAGNRKSVKDIPIIGLSNFDESGGPFDYRNGITRLVKELKRMGEWCFQSIESPFDKEMIEFEKDCATLSDKEKKLQGIFKKIKAVEQTIQANPECTPADRLNFQRNYPFKANQFNQKLVELKAYIERGPQPAPAAWQDDHDDEDEKNQFIPID